MAVEQWRPHIQLPRHIPGPYHEGVVAEMPDWSKVNDKIQESWQSVGQNLAPAIQASQQDKNEFGEYIGSMIKNTSNIALEGAMGEMFWDMEYVDGQYQKVQGSGKHWDELSAAEKRVQSRRMQWAQNYQKQINETLKNIGAGELNINNINWNSMKDHNNFAAFIDHIATNNEPGDFNITFNEFEEDWDDIKKRKGGFLGLGKGGKEKRRLKKGYKTHMETGTVRWIDKDGKNRTITVNEMVRGQLLFIPNTGGKDLAVEEIKAEGKIIDSDLTSIHSDLNVEQKENYIKSEALSRARNFKNGYRTTTGSGGDPTVVDYNFIWNNMMIDPTTGYNNGYSNPTKYNSVELVTDPKFAGKLRNLGGEYVWNQNPDQLKKMGLHNGFMEYHYMRDGKLVEEALTHERQVENFIAERILDNVPQPWKDYKAPTSVGDKITSITAFRNQNIVIENDIENILFTKVNRDNKGNVISGVKKDLGDRGSDNYNAAVESVANLVNKYSGKETNIAVLTRKEAELKFGEAMYNDFMGIGEDSTDLADLDKDLKVDIDWDFSWKLTRDEDKINEFIYEGGDKANGLSVKAQKIFLEQFKDGDLYQRNKDGDMMRTPMRLTDQESIYKWIINNTDQSTTVKTHYTGEYIPKIINYKKIK